MVYGIVQWTIISIIIIMLAHHLFSFLKQTLTVPKVKDLVSQPSKSYKEIEETLANKSMDTVAKKNPELNKMEMKDELKQFFNELTQNKPSTIPESGSLPSSNWLSSSPLNELSIKEN
jgi:hypothetical protein